MENKNKIIGLVVIVVILIIGVALNLSDNSDRGLNKYEEKEQVIEHKYNPNVSDQLNQTLFLGDNITTTFTTIIIIGITLGLFVIFIMPMMRMMRMGF